MSQRRPRAIYHANPGISPLTIARQKNVAFLEERRRPSHGHEENADGCYRVRRRHVGKSFRETRYPISRSDWQLLGADIVYPRKLTVRIAG